MTLTVTRRPSTPGEILSDLFMEPLKIKQGDLAACLDISRRRVNEIINNKREITPDTAIRLAKFFKNTPQFWLNLQNQYNVWAVQQDKEMKKVYNNIKTYKECNA